MSEPYIGEIRLFAGNFAPVNWAFCNGQAMAISENEALFTLIGTTYGGDGEQTFNLPDLRGRAPIHQGTRPGGSTYVMGQTAGSETVTLAANQYPQHSHTLGATSAKANSASPSGARPAADSAGITGEYSTAAANTTMNAGMVQSNGGGAQPHENLMPLLVINFIIALFGIFPSQN